MDPSATGFNGGKIPNALNVSYGHFPPRLVD
jgi:hypothetical protein